MGLLDDQPTNTQYYYGSDFGNYQFVSLTDIINQFMLVYVGEDKIIPKAKRLDVAFHAQRALAELSFDTFKAFKAEEFTLPPSLQMPLPQDYVNYTRMLWVDSSGIKHPIYPTKHTQNPTSYYQNSDGEFKINPVGTLTLSSNVVVLDGDYSDILINGMRVVSPNLPAASYINDISTTIAGVTSITLKNKTGSATKDAILTTNERLMITRFKYLNVDGVDGAEYESYPNGRLIANTSHINNSVSGTKFTCKLTAAIVVGDTQINVDNVSTIEEGMFINHPSFINSNAVDDGASAITVVGVGTSTVELSHQATFASTSAIDEISFILHNTDSTTWSNYKSTSPSENQNDYQDDTYWPAGGERYGLDPIIAQTNGSFFIDDLRGLIHFSSNLSGETIVLDYISDSLGTDKEMQVHKFAEEAMYKWISHAILSGKANIPEYQVNRLKKERFAAIRTAKLRLSNIKLEELTQILRGKSKWIKH